MQYRARPFVCGAIGPWNEKVLNRLIDAAPGGLSAIHREPNAILLSSAKLERWTAGSAHGYLWSPVSEGGRPGSWREAAEERMAAGLCVENGVPVLHSDGLGLQEIYLRAHGAALYFSVRIDPLLHLDDSRLHVDWAAWAALLITAVLDDQTPFEEVRRAEPATAYRYADGRTSKVGFLPSWLTERTGPEVTPKALVETIAACLPRRRLRRVSVTLSGGWDSRLLAGLNRTITRNRMHALTTSNDDGAEHDTGYATEVARALRIRQHTVIPGPEAWLAEHHEVRRRLQYQSWQHTWLMPMARLTHQRRDLVLDGFAGDVLFRAKDYYTDVAAAPDPAAARQIMWERVASARFTHEGVFAPGVPESVTEASRPAFDRVADALGEHHLWPLFARLGFGTRQASTWLFEPETDLRFPFAHPDVLRAAARLPLTTRTTGDPLYRSMLRHAHATSAALPSTNDPWPKKPLQARRQSSPAALARMTEAILAHDSVVTAFGPQLRRVLTDPEIRNRQGVWNPTLYPLQWASLLADWLTAYDSRLVPSPWPYVTKVRA
ncbi:hypothetical protein GCM10009555_040270 [Acrocarpospora macrocephala]|uniref:Asparagine synthetase domain-containing protein n=1 Tax=Acrocarpospora macrocephala TaxID=150177 RepID=A0A5M3WNA2_9ACTN|nr:asparagine synthase C-terminal domain-containing protein [Acrocarpospora macrocephala]GES10000.1 hypothetical protein Amac_035960 [Acrocarpospora macrocephala]